MGKEIISPPDGFINGYGYVDLGLPSGTLWATCNVLANEPWEAGGYFGWGETEEQNWNHPQLYPFYKDQTSDFGIDVSINHNKIPFNIEGNPKYDVASNKLGNPWQIPNIKNWLEIIGPEFLKFQPTCDYYPPLLFYKNPEDYMNAKTLCEFQMVEINGQIGTKITGPNGKSIFLPSAGLKTYKIFYKEEDIEGIYQCCDVYRNTTGRKEKNIMDGFLKNVHQFNLTCYGMRAEFKTNEYAIERSKAGFFSAIRIEIDDLYKGLSVRPVINNIKK